MRPRDYGAVRRYGAAHIIGAVVMITVAAGYFAYNFVRDRNANVGVAKAWDIKGPPCPAFTAAEFAAKGYKVRQKFDYDGITIGRHSGHVSCSDVKQAGGVGLFVDRICQFTSPVLVTVESKAGAYYFLPGAGKPATIVIHDGRPRCVMASKYTLENS